VSLPPFSPYLPVKHGYFFTHLQELLILLVPSGLLHRQIHSVTMLIFISVAWVSMLIFRLATHRHVGFLSTWNVLAVMTYQPRSDLPFLRVRQGQQLQSLLAIIILSSIILIMLSFTLQ